MSSYRELRKRASQTWQQVERPSRPRITVNTATCGRAKGGLDILDAIWREVTQRRLEADTATTGCNGLCYAEPLVEIAWPGGTRILYGYITEDKVPKLIEETLAKGGRCPELALAVVEGKANGIPPLSSLEFWSLQERRLMANCGIIDPENIDHSIARGGYEGLAKALAMQPEDVVKEVTSSGLWGRGGAAFPTGRKWDFLRGARNEPKYILCNADEGDPGAWVNRMVMEGDPHLLLEGIVIAAYATGARYAYIYIRDEYPLAAQMMEKAITQARERGLVGEHVLDSDFSCEVYVFRGAGAYVCGEETGLIASIEGLRGMPKIRPPYPAQSGVFAKPSNVNNVETLANVPLILRNGAEWYASKGTERNKGTKMFSLSGHIQRVGCLEVPFGTPMSRVLFEAGGGVPDGYALKAIQSGGPLGGILPASEVNLPLEPEPFRERGVLMGSGGLIAISDKSCIIDMALYFSWFAEDESCGRCTTCRGGNQRMVEILRRIGNGGGRASDIEVLNMIGRDMANANCVHGQASPTAVMNALRYFTAELNEHIHNKRCPAKVCPGLIRYQVTEQGEKLPAAAAICPTGAIVQQDGWYDIDQGLCIKCDACREVAPESIAVVDAEVAGVVST